MPYVIVAGYLVALCLLEQPTTSPIDRPTPDSSDAARQSSAKDPVIGAYENWWYRCAAFPEKSSRKDLERRIQENPEDAPALFWLAQDMRRRTLGVFSPDETDAYIETLRRAAALNFPPAQAQFARELMDGTRVTRDVPEAKRLLNAAARHEEAMLVAGTIFIEAPKPDLERGEQLLAGALRLGHLRASTGLAQCYFLKGDFKSALETARRGADAGVVECQLLLGRWYRDGKGTVRDAEAAKQWFEKAHNAGHPFGTFELARLIADSADPDDKQRAFELLEEAQTRLPDAKLYLARACLYNVLNTGYDIPRALQLLQDLAKESNADACYELGTALLEGVWCTRDEQRATRLLERAASKGHPEATNKLMLIRHIQSLPDKKREDK